ncbi:unnamed protein product [Caenorhabditis bovis]|uniref:Uncharacterized protein n=1 Tax=Caenorhabditis bovis TaxID=2654633 RepID=A0A8S1F6E2_9PELO|nr:unnamed protein product [Caenorhabditis bovis]
MRRVVADQSAAFQSDHFLARLANYTDARFALFEHAPAAERRQRFRALIQQHKLPLTFIETGVNVPLVLETHQDDGIEIAFRSAAFIFNGVWVRVIGTMSLNSLEGPVRFEMDTGEHGDEVAYLTETELQILRDRGLSV